MANDILVRLRLNGEELKRETDRALAPLQAAAARAGTSAGQGLASGISGSSKIIEQAVERSTEALTAQEAALRRLNPLSAQYAADKARMTAETAQLKVALKAGEISQESYNLAVLEGRTALKAQALAMNEAERAYLATMRTQQSLTAATGQSRAGMQQLGYQLGDVATMFSLGAPPAQIFGSQIGQVTQAVQLMGGGGGALGKVAGFLGGPWGIALSVGAVALSPLIGKIFETEEALDSMGEAARDALAALHNSLFESSAYATAANAVLDRRATITTELATATRELASAQSASNAVANVPGMQMGGANVSAAQVRLAQERVAAARADLADSNREMRELRTDAAELVRILQLRGEAAAAAEQNRGGRAGNDNQRQQRTAEISEEAAAIRDQTKATEQYILGLQREIETFGLSGEALRQHEVERQISLAGSQAEKDAIEALNIERLEAIALIDRQAAARVEADLAASKANDARDRMKVANNDNAEDFRRQHEDAVRDVADLYEDLFSGNTNSIWKNFKQQGTAVLADMAAQWTLSLLSGQTGKGGERPGNPLGGLFNLIGSGGASPGGGLAGLFGGGAGGKAAAGSAGAGGGVASLGGSLAGAPGPVGMFFAGTAAANIIGEGLEDLTGLKYNSTAGTFGGLLGGIIGGLFKKTPKGSASLTGLDSASLTSRGSGMADSVGGLAGAFQDQLKQIAEALGANVGSFGVSIGQRGDQFRVSGSAGVDAGQKSTKGFLYTGADAEEAVMVALRDSISDGALQGISEASVRILTKAGTDLETALGKAILIESVPKLLRARLDPLGAALDEIDGKYRKLADAMKEGGASAEQLAQTKQLWQLERADALKQIGEASAGLKEFLLALNAGSASPLSLRQQRAEAEAAFAPFEQQAEAARDALAEVERLKAGGGSAAEIAAAQESARTAASSIDQSGYQNAAQLLLGVSREMDASGAGFFATFDRIRNLTGGAIGAINGAAATPGAARDPFTELTASHTGDISAQMFDQTKLLNRIATKLESISPGNDNSSWLSDSRSFIR